MRLPNLLHLFHRVNSRKADIVRTLASDSKRSFFALADQGMVSLGNFGVNILLAKYFDQIGDLSDFGSFWILMELILFLNSVQAALVVYPLTVRGAAMDRGGMASMAGISMGMTLLAWPLLAVCVIATALIGHIPLEAGIWATIAMAMWQLQETVRRSLMAQLRFRAALIGDSISYLGQFAIVAILAHMGKLSLVATFQAMAITSGVAAIVQAAQVGLRRFDSSELRGFGEGSWSLGRWVLFGNLTNLITGPMMSWNFAYWAGKELLGVNYALTNLLRLTNPVSFAIAMLILPNAARARAQNGMRAAKSMMLRFGLMGVVMLAPYLGVMILAPHFSISFVYRAGANELLGHATALRVGAIGAGLMFTVIATGEFLNAVERSRHTFMAQIISAGVILVVAMPLTAKYDVFGAALGGAIASAVHLLLHLMYIQNLPDAPPAASADAFDGAAAPNIDPA